MMKHPLQYISLQSGKIVDGCLLILLSVSGLKKYLEVPLPIDRVAAASAFDNDYLAAGALNSIYGALYLSGNFDGNQSVNYYTSMYGDELKNFSPVASYLALYSNN